MTGEDAGSARMDLSRFVPTDNKLRAQISVCPTCSRPSWTRTELPDQFVRFACGHVVIADEEARAAFLYGGV